mgnify:CR=1 FL=1
MDTWVGLMEAIEHLGDVLDQAIAGLYERDGMGEVLQQIEECVRRLSRLVWDSPGVSPHLVTRLDEAEVVLRYVRHAKGGRVEGVLLGILVANGAVEHAEEEIEGLRSTTSRQYRGSAY